MRSSNVSAIHFQGIKRIKRFVHHLFKVFFFKAAVNGQTFMPSIAKDNKKDAKCNAAWFALQEMGLVKKDPTDPL